MKLRDVLIAAWTIFIVGLLALILCWLCYDFFKTVIQLIFGG
jgi:hypothetical protein